MCTCGTSKSGTDEPGVRLCCAVPSWTGTRGIVAPDAASNTHCSVCTVSARSSSSLAAVCRRLVAQTWPSFQLLRMQNSSAFPHFTRSQLQGATEKVERVQIALNICLIVVLSMSIPKVCCTLLREPNFFLFGLSSFLCTLYHVNHSAEITTLLSNMNIY